MELQIKKPCDVLRDSDGVGRYVIADCRAGEVVVVARNHPEDAEDDMRRFAQLIRTNGEQS